MKIPVLTYHSNNVSGGTYADNDHVALASDLLTLSHLGWNIVPLREVVNWVLEEPEVIAEPTVALAFDDGSWFDYFDIDHPACGMQRSFFNILKDFRDSDMGPRQPGLHASTFVITSPQAREQLDRSSLVGKGWWGEEWWADAQASGLMSVECHSWDHLHPGVEPVAQREQLKGDFSLVQDPQDCAAQVAQAGDYIASRLGGQRPQLFAYPWGQASDYLAREYFPQQQERHGFSAAFNGNPLPVERGMNRWALPRFICGRDWDSPATLERLFKDCR